MVPHFMSRKFMSRIFSVPVSISQVIGCEDRLRNDLYYVELGVKLYSNQPSQSISPDLYRFISAFPVGGFDNSIITASLS